MKGQRSGSGTNSAACYTFAALLYLTILTPVTLLANRFEIKH